MLRDEYILEPLLKSLRHKIAGFRQEPDHVQIHLAHLIWNSTNHKRQHSRLPEQMTITYQELAKKFGQNKFMEINNRLGIFDVTNNWSMHENLTKGYKLTTKVQNILASFSRARDKYASKIIGGDGRYVNTQPKAIASKDMDGITARSWKHPYFRSIVPVDVPELKKLRRWLISYKNSIEDRHWNGDLFFQGKALEILKTCKHRIHLIDQIIKMSNTTTGGKGNVIHRYVESTAGRLFAKDINLQTAPGAIKQAALHGMWEYDFENCHYAIFHQLAVWAGTELLAIENYIENKSDVRAQISSEVGISLDNTKFCLLAVMYGARESTWNESAIPKQLNDGAAVRRLYDHPLFSGLMKDTKIGRKAILNNWERKSNKAYTNHMDKVIGIKEPPEKILAHLIQGIETKMLHIAIDLYQEEILLLQHDGFAAIDRLDMGLITAKVKEETGFDMELSEDKICIGKDITFK